MSYNALNNWQTLFQVISLKVLKYKISKSDNALKAFGLSFMDNKTSFREFYFELASIKREKVVLRGHAWLV